MSANSEYTACQYAYKPFAKNFRMWGWKVEGKERGQIQSTPSLQDLIYHIQAKKITHLRADLDELIIGWIST